MRLDFVLLTVRKIYKLLFFSHTIEESTRFVVRASLHNILVHVHTSDLCAILVFIYFVCVINFSLRINFGFFVLTDHCFPTCIEGAYSSGGRVHLLRRR